VQRSANRIASELVDRHNSLKHPDTQMYGQDTELARLIDALSAALNDVVQAEVIERVSGPIEVAVVLNG
jgi:hypothetical protein